MSVLISEFIQLVELIVFGITLKEMLLIFSGIIAILDWLVLSDSSLNCFGQLTGWETEVVMIIFPTSWLSLGSVRLGALVFLIFVGHF